MALSYKKFKTKSDGKMIADCPILEQAFFNYWGKI